MTEPVSLADSAAQLGGLAPLSRRVAALDAGLVAGYARLPFAVLVGRTVRVDWAGPSLDCVVRAGELVGWLQGQTREVPALRDVEWRGALPPARGWQRVDRVPDAVIRDVVRKGAATLRDAAAREGVPGGQPRAEVADALLDSVVLTAAQGGVRAEVSLRTISAMTRMGFIAEGSHVAIDVCGRWSRVAAEYGSAYAERPGLALGIVS